MESVADPDEAGSTVMPTLRLGPDAREDDDAPATDAELERTVALELMRPDVAVTTDRRFLALSYLGFLPIAIAWPQEQLVVLGLSNAMLIAFVMIVWRRSAPAPRALGDQSRDSALGFARIE